MAAAGHSGFFTSKRGRIVLENLTAYAFLFPALLLIFLFGIFPVGFAFFVSLHNWRRFPGDYDALENYLEALGDFAYVAFFWLAVGALVYGLYLGWRWWRRSAENEERPAAFLYIIPGILNAGSMLLFIRWFFAVLIIILNIPRALLGQDVNLEVFVGAFLDSFRSPEVAEMGNLWLLSAGAALAVSAVVARRLFRSNSSTYLILATGMCLALAGGYLILQLTLTQIQAAILAAQENGTELPIWSQIVLISLGAALIGAAYFVWRRATHTFDTRCFILLIGAALLLMLGGYLFIGQLPALLAQADDDLLNGFSVTVMYSMGTVPFQLGIGMVLAYLLFQNIRGKALFRIIYFLPYITPWVATSVVFKVLLSHRDASVGNQFLGLFGIPPQKWLLEPTGVFQLIFGPDLPQWLAGPGLALVAIMIFSVWTYIGYDAVVFLAGMGNIQPDLYEAARIDGATRWHEFRHITFPLLSPTTFFLSLIAVIGTFQAFTQIWIMRSPAAGGSVDTVGVYIFQKVTQTNPELGYGSAMAFVLFAVILVLTLIQNRIAGRRVFYG